MRLSSQSKILKWPFYLGLMMAVVAVYFRLYPITVYPKYVAQNTASLVVYTKIKRGLDSNILAQFPHQTPAQREEVAKVSIRQFMRDQDIRIKSLTRSIADDLLKEYRGSPHFLMEVDPYYYLDLTENILEKSKIANSIRGRDYFNPKMLAPSGNWYPLDYHPYLGAYLYKTVHFFNSKISLMEAVSWLPILLACLAIIPFLMITIQVFELPGFAAAASGLFFVVCPMFLKRSLYGWYDTDTYNILFPAIMLFILMKLLIQKSFAWKKSLFLSLGLALVTALYSLFWRGWLLLFSLYTVSSVIAAVATNNQKNYSPQRLKFLGVYLAACFLFIGLLWGPDGLSGIFTDAYQFSLTFFTKTFSLWPDVFISVGELRPSTFLSLSKLLGNPFIVFFSGFGIFWSLIESYRKKTTHLSPILALLIISVLFFTLAMSAERFVLLLVIPISLGLGLAFKMTFSRIENIRQFKLAEETGKLIIFSAKSCLLLAFVFLAFYTAHQEIRNDHPIYNTSWDKVMRAIKTKTPENSIVTSWWSPGHFITGMGKRRVTFDGATQNTPQAYWVARLFMEPSEDKALSILRMLDLSANKATEYLEAQNIPLSSSVDILLEALPLSTDKAGELFKSLLNSRQKTSALLALTHGDKAPPPGYLFVYDDMIRQVMALEYVGNWNFKKAEEFSELLRKNPDKIAPNTLRRGTSENARLLWSLSSGPWFEDTLAFEEAASNDSLRFTNGLSVRKDFSTAYLDSKKYGKGVPLNVFFMKEGSLQKIQCKLPTLNLSALIIKDANESALQKKDVYRCVLADERLIRSMAFRLFYLKGEGLKNFTLVESEENPKTQNKFYVYKIEWAK